MTVVGPPIIVLHTLIFWPASSRSNPIHLCGIQRIIVVYHLIRVSKERMHVHAYLKFIFWVSGLQISFLVQLKQRLEMFIASSNYSKHHRKTQASCTQNRLRRPPYCNPNG